jgi:hypothetical protein
MWRVNVTCSGEDWKKSGATFKILADTFATVLIGSKKLPDETRIMSYKIEDFSEVESFQEECAQFTGFDTDFESL